MSREGYTAGAPGPGWPCMAPGCTKPGHQKPACPEHLSLLPYPAQLAAEVARGAAGTVAVECSSCGESYDRDRSVKVKPVCPVCRIERDKRKDRERQAKRMAAS